MLRTCVLVCAALVLVACKADGPRFLDAGREVPIDAPIDVAVPPPDAGPPALGQELTGGAGRMTSGRFVVDVQVGHGVAQQPATGAASTVEGNAPIKP